MAILANCWPFLYELSGCGFKPHCSHFSFRCRYRVCFEQGVPSHSHNYRVYIHSKMRMWHDKKIQSPCHQCYIFESFTHIHFMSTFFSRGILTRGHRISCTFYHIERTNNKPFSGSIRPKHVTTSREVAHQSWVARCSLHVL